MTNNLKEIVIPKEKAVFWLDKHGYWNNDGGRIRRKKIIDYFHAAISKDDSGYFLSQIKENVLEKVYFRYEDTALFVFNVDVNEEIMLTLNTGQKMLLTLENLYVHDDNLYINKNDERIKFSERALFQISPIIKEEQGMLFIMHHGKRYNIPEKYLNSG